MKSTSPCCASKSEWTGTAQMLKALGHPVRLEMVHRLRQNGHCCCGELCDCFSQSQSTISQHLAVLADAGIILRRSEGNRSVYSLNSKALETIEQQIAAIASAELAGVSSD